LREARADRDRGPLEAPCVYLDQAIEPIIELEQVAMFDGSECRAFGRHATRSDRSIELGGRAVDAALAGILQLSGHHGENRRGEILRKGGLLEDHLDRPVPSDTHLCEGGTGIPHFGGTEHLRA